jgi:hypothetical protein
MFFHQIIQVATKSGQPICDAKNDETKDKTKEKNPRQWEVVLVIIVILANMANTWPANITMG